jgi:hypothetical protein
MDYWIESMFELDLKNTVLRSILKFHNDRLTTAQDIVGTRLQIWVFWVQLSNGLLDRIHVRTQS